MRWLLLVSVLGCTPRFDTKARTAANGKPTGATELAVECGDEGLCGAAVRGVVTSRGGDSIDWYAFEIPPTCGTSTLEASLRWTPPRGPSRLGVAIYAAPKRPLARKAAEKGKAVATLQGARPGRYLVRVSTMNLDAAGAYTLRVFERETQSCGLLRDIYRPRPEDMPPLPNTIAVTSAGMSSTSRDWNGDPSIVIDATDPRVRAGARGVLVDDRGVPVKHGEIEIVEVFGPDDSVRLASARLLHARRFRRLLLDRWPYWAVRLGPL